MNDLLEPLLRDTLETRAAQLDPGARARLMAVDYRPRHGRIRALPTIGAVAVTAAATALALIFTLGSSPTPAFAGWTARPTPAPPGQTARALARCQLGRAVLVDTRGPFTAVLYAGANRFGTCLNGPDFTSGGTAPAREVTVHPGQVSVFEQTASGGRSAATMLDGRTGAGVTGVRIHLSNGRLATATVVRGWYLVWWPGRVHGTTVTIETSKGAHTIALPASDRVGAGSSCAGPPGTGCATIGFGTAVGG